MSDSLPGDGLRSQLAMERMRIDDYLRDRDAIWQEIAAAYAKIIA